MSAPESSSAGDKRTADTIAAQGGPVAGSSSNTAPQLPSEEAGPSVQTPPAKRGPGRPRKNPLPPPTPDGEQPPKRKRGRPPRPRTEAELAAEEAKKNMPKRPRGRPRKNPLPPQQQPPTAPVPSASTDGTGQPTEASISAGDTANLPPTVDQDLIARYTHFPSQNQ